MREVLGEHGLSNTYESKKDTQKHARSGDRGLALQSGLRGRAARCSVRHRHHARGHGRGGAAVGAARCVREVPGIARGSIEAWLAGKAEAEVAGVGLAEKDQAGGFQAARLHRILVGTTSAKKEQARVVGTPAMAPLRSFMR